MQKKTIFALLGSLLVLLAGGFWLLTNGQADKAAKSDKIQAVATFYPVYEFTKAILGEEGEVNLLIKAGTEVHGYEPSTKDMTTIQDADVFVYADENMEMWVEHLSESIDTQKVLMVKGTGDMLLMAGSEDSHDHHDHEEGEEEHHHAFDPHVWLSPVRTVTMVSNIRESLSEAYPDKAATFEKNAAAYIEKLEALDSEYQEALATAQQKSFVTQHAAFGYLALDYGLNQIAVTGVSADSEPTAKRLAELTDYVKANGIKYIYFEENASSTVSKTLATEAGVETAVLNPLESLTNEQMAKGVDYFSVMRDNLAALRLTTDLAGEAIKPEQDTTKTVYNGYFDDADVMDRSLDNYTGDWQSVYPYLVDGTLDEIWEYKAKKSQGAMTAAEYKDYYTIGYQTDVESIVIDGKKNTVTFIRNGEKKTFTYKYVGYEILTYKRGNRGVRYLFETEDADAGEFKYIQFSDHNIKDEPTGHFHIFWGNTSQEEILTEMEHWPTYYPAGFTGREIAQEIMAH